MDIKTKICDVCCAIIQPAEQCKVTIAKTNENGGTKNADICPACTATVKVSDIYALTPKTPIVTVTGE